MRRGKFSKVIGIGLPKTGTTTLGAMLRRLGHHHVPYDLSLIDSVAPPLGKSGIHPIVGRKPR